MLLSTAAANTLTCALCKDNVGAHEQFDGGLAYSYASLAGTAQAYSFVAKIGCMVRLV